MFKKAFQLSFEKEFVYGFDGGETPFDGVYLLTEAGEMLKTEAGEFMEIDL